MEGVRDLYVSVDSDGGSSALPKLLKSMPHLVNLYCCDGTVNVGDLMQLPMLRRLELESTVVTGSRSTSRLYLRLERLSITKYHCALDDSASNFLTPAFLPRLHRIDTVNYRSIAPLIPQLEIITTGRYNMDNTTLARAKSLLLLPLSQFSGNRLAMLSNLRSLPAFLHIEFVNEVTSALRELLAANKPGLRIIILDDHGIDDSVKSLIKLIEERGIRVQMVDEGLKFDGAIEEMYRIRAEERRATEKRATGD